MMIRHMDKMTKVVHMKEDEIRTALREMEQDPALNTVPVLATGTAQPMEYITFYKKHLGYLLAHPKVNPEHYLTNLRTMIKIRL